MFTGKTLYTLLDPKQVFEWNHPRDQGVEEHQLSGQPTFESITDQLIETINGDEVIAHNMPFVEAFFDQELSRVYSTLTNLYDLAQPFCLIQQFRTQHPGRKTGLEDLRKMCGISDKLYTDNTVLSRAQLSMHIWQHLQAN